MENTGSESPLSESPLIAAARITVNALRDNGFLDGEHAITGALVEELAREWVATSSSTQKAAIARELRGTIKLLPSQHPTDTGVTDRFFSGLATAMSKSATARDDEPTLFT